MRSALPAAILLLAAPALLAAPLHAQSQGPDDPTIVAIFDAANTADMESGALAEQRASSKDIREFGAMLVRDHRAVRQQGRDLAAKLGVTPTPPKDDQSAKDHAAAMARLRSLQGTEFDHAFLQYEAAFHQAVRMPASPPGRQPPPSPSLPLPPTCSMRSASPPRRCSRSPCRRSPARPSPSRCGSTAPGAR